MLATAFVAVWCCGTLLNLQESPSLRREFFLMLMYFSPTWLPFVFAAFALGRRSVSVWLVVAFTVVESIALYLMSIAATL
ncbi:MAG: hypothetical protein DWQ37_12885 [Planctomycetota bacterium]|nr:MAG: hypothetical protein DWQ37_12885 [Planctomycetota bacterium]